jgi:hypothetical protein
MEEEEEDGVAPEQPKVWRMFARHYTLKAANFSALHKHYAEVW